MEVKAELAVRCEETQHFHWFSPCSLFLPSPTLTSSTHWHCLCYKHTLSRISCTLWRNLSRISCTLWRNPAFPLMLSQQPVLPFTPFSIFYLLPYKCTMSLSLIYNTSLQGQDGSGGRSGCTSWRSPAPAGPGAGAGAGGGVQQVRDQQTAMWAGSLQGPVPAAHPAGRAAAPGGHRRIRAAAQGMWLSVPC